MSEQLDPIARPWEAPLAGWTAWYGPRIEPVVPPVLPRRPAQDAAEGPADHDPVCGRFRCWSLEGLDHPVRAARRCVAATLDEWGYADAVESAALATSELVTNALRHGRPPVRLALSIGSAVTVEVGDGDPAPPCARECGEYGGYGLTVLAHLAEITVATHSAGKVVRARLHDVP